MAVAMAEPCVFCEIVAGRELATVLDDGHSFMVIEPLTPVTDGHVLVIPKRHVPDARQSPVTTAIVMAHAARRATHHESANILTSIGRPATQSVFHLHVHVVPRTADDGLMLPWGTVYGEDPSAPHWCRVAQQLSDGNGGLRAAIEALSDEWAYSDEEVVGRFTAMARRGCADQLRALVAAGEAGDG